MPYPSLTGCERLQLVGAIAQPIALLEVKPDQVMVAIALLT